MKYKIIIGIVMLLLLCSANVAAAAAACPIVPSCTAVACAQATGCQNIVDTTGGCPAHAAVFNPYNLSSCFS